MANGDALTRPEAEATGAGAGAETGAEELTVVVAGAAAGAGLVGAGALTASTFSPGSPITAIRPFTATLEPSGAAIANKVPLSKASRSIVALSVSTSAITSPGLMVSPTFLCHLASTPSVMEGLNAGMVISLAIGVWEDGIMP